LFFSLSSTDAVRRNAALACAAVACASLLGACAPAARQTGAGPALPPQIAAGDPDAWYRDAEAGGKTVMPIDARQSLITVIVHRGGALARLGHDHAVASRSVSGFVAPEQGRADLAFRLDQMTVDEPGLRKQAGFDTQPSDAAIEGTRTNMLTRVLDADHYPLVRIHVERATGQAPLRAAITLHGVTRTLDIPTLVEAVPGGLRASGDVSLKQSDFGIEPFSVMAGALAVQDQIDIHFALTATARTRAASK
jgi:hypothetical protein